MHWSDIIFPLDIMNIEQFQRLNIYRKIYCQEHSIKNVKYSEQIKYRLQL